MTDRVDRRRTCECGHRHKDHATGGTQCLAMVNDVDRSALVACWCHRWTPRQPMRFRRSIALAED